MKIGINLATDNLRRGLEQAVNSSGCPPCIVRSVLEALLAQVRAAEAEEINREAAKYQKDLEAERQAAEAAQAAAEEAEANLEDKHPADGEDAREGPQNG